MPHVVDRVDGHADLADLAVRDRVVGVVAHLGRQVERDRQARRAGREQLVVAGVGLGGGAEAGVLAHGPRAGRCTSSGRRPGCTGTRPARPAAASRTAASSPVHRLDRETRLCVHTTIVGRHDPEREGFAQRSEDRARAGDHREHRSSSSRTTPRAAFASARRNQQDSGVGRTAPHTPPRWHLSVTQIPTWSGGNTAPAPADAQAPGHAHRRALRAASPRSATAAWARSGGPTDTLLRRDVAVKEVILPPGLAPSDRDAMYERTMREARAAAALQHPAVVQVYDVVTENGRPWIVMELLDARSLADMVIEDGPVAPRAVAKIGIALLGALEVAHAHGVLHRDVKPANVLICADGRCVLTDFGVARMPTDVQLTTPGMVLGSPHFISPERAMGSEFGPPSDLFSLGVTLYTAVEGRPPFDQGDPIETMHAVVEDPPRPARPRRPADPGADGPAGEGPGPPLGRATAPAPCCASCSPARWPAPHGRLITDPRGARRHRPQRRRSPSPPADRQPAGQIGGRAMLGPGRVAHRPAGPAARRRPAAARATRPRAGPRRRQPAAAVRRTPTAGDPGGRRHQPCSADATPRSGAERPAGRLARQRRQPTTPRRRAHPRCPGSRSTRRWNRPTVAGRATAATRLGGPPRLGRPGADPGGGPAARRRFLAGVATRDGRHARGQTAGATPHGDAGRPRSRPASRERGIASNVPRPGGARSGSTTLPDQPAPARSASASSGTGTRHGSSRPPRTASRPDELPDAVHRVEPHDASLAGTAPSSSTPAAPATPCGTASGGVVVRHGGVYSFYLTARTPVRREQADLRRDGRRSAHKAADRRPTMICRAWTRCATAPHGLAGRRPRPGHPGRAARPCSTGCPAPPPSWPTGSPAR